MARRDRTDIILILGGLTVFELLSLKGTFGPALQEVATKVAQTFVGQRCDPGTAPADIRVLRAANPNFVRQMWQWKAERILAGENPFDWNAFRRHLTAINAPDPGGNPPAEFC